MLSKSNLKKKYARETKEIEVKAWDGSVEIRKLTIKEENDVRAMLMNNATPAEMVDNKIEISVALLNEANVLAVSYCLVNPSMSAEDLNGLNSDAFDGVNEIKTALDEWSKPKK